MMVKYFCDRCGQEMDRYGQSIQVGKFTEMAMVCEACLASLDQWMAGAVLTPDDPLGETAEEAPLIPRHSVRRYRAVLEPEHPWLKKGIQTEVKEE